MTITEGRTIGAYAYWIEATSPDRVRWRGRDEPQHDAPRDSPVGTLFARVLEQEAEIARLRRALQDCQDADEE